MRREKSLYNRLARSLRNEWEEQKRRGGKMRGTNAPVEEGREYDVKIDAQGSKGDGIAHYEGFVIFIPGAAVGPDVRVRITARRRTFAIGAV